MDEGKHNSLIINLIEKFFDDNDLKQCKQELISECEKKNIAKYQPTTNQSDHNDQTQKLLTLYDNGDYEKFFQHWKMLGNQGNDMDTLEFYLRIYFATFPLRNTNITMKKRYDYMEAFKQYLETPNTLKLGDNAALTPYFALPYVKKVESHPVFKELLQVDWVEQIKDWLKTYLKTMFNPHGQLPLSLNELLAVYFEKQSSKGYANEQYVKELERKYEAHKKRNTKLQADYHKVILVASELVDALEQTIRGNPISSKHLQHLCAKMLENQENQQRILSTLSQSPVSKEPDDPEHNSIASFEPNVQNNINEMQTDIKLNFLSLKHYLEADGNSVKEIALVTQALRLVITEASKESRDNFVKELVTKDIFCLNSAEKKESIFTRFYLNHEEIICEQMCRFVNSLASLKTGRAYLIRSNTLLATIVDCLKNPDYSKTCNQHIIATLQKLSIRRSVQMYLIKQGFVSWLLQYLNEYHKLSDYALEYGCALLMNLSLTTLGKKAAADDPDFILKLLSDLLKHENKEIRPYLNGTLYSILSLPNLRHKAKKTDLCQLLDKAVQNPKNPSDVKQVPFIIKQLKGELVDKQPPPSDDEMSTAEEDEDEEEDYLESDINAHDSLEPEPGHLSGLPLLLFQFPPELEQHNSPSERNVAQATSVSSYTNKRQNNKWASGNTYAIEKVDNAAAVRQVRRVEGSKIKKPTTGVLSSATFTVRTTVKEKPSASAAKTVGGGINARKIERGGIGKALNKSKQISHNSVSKKDPVQALTKRRTSVQQSESKNVGKQEVTTISPLVVTEQKPAGDKIDKVTKQKDTNVHVSTTGSVATEKTTKQIDTKVDQGKIGIGIEKTTKQIDTKVDQGKIDLKTFPPVNINTNSVKPESESVNKDSGDNENTKPPTPDNGLAPGLIERVNTRIPEDANFSEYLTAFGSRPKIVRTPDKEAVKKKNGAHFMIF